MCMWTLKIRGREVGNIYEERAIKFKVRIYFHSHNYYEEKKKIFFIGSGIVEGDAENKKNFFKDLKKDSRVESLEDNNDFFVCIYSEKAENVRGELLKASYNPRLIFIKPAVINVDGWEEWEVSSTEKKDLNDFINESAKLKGAEYKILKLKQEKINNLMIYTTSPNLTQKQKTAISLAIEKGYYGYPRKITLKELAEINNSSLSTFQFHLAKAEAKMIPFVSKQF